MTGGQLAVRVSDRFRPQEGKDVALRLIPVLLCLPLLFTFEFNAFDAQAPNILYRREVGGGFRLIDVLILSLAALQLVLARRTRVSLRFPTSLALPVSLAAVAWAISLAYGFLTGGTQLLYDWRSIVLGVAVSMITITGVRDRRDARLVLDALVVVSAGFSLYVLADFATGGGVRTGATGRIPLWDQHALAILSFSPVLAVARWLMRAPHRAMALACSAPCSLVVLLASRRNNWGELLCALGLLLLVEGRVRQRLQAVGLVAVLLGVVAAALGPARLIARVESINPSASGTPETATNSGHVGDVLDAWDAVKASPILGLGQGKSYRTSRITDWKTESWMVHNAPLHVWIRYGLLGLLAYFWWHAAYFRYLTRLRVRWRLIHDSDGRSTSALLLATLAWSVGVFVIGLFFSEWSYTSLQRMVLIGTLWGLTLHPSVRQVLVNAGSPLADRVAPQRSRGMMLDMPAIDMSER
jgi:hypothetical protein